MSFSRDASLRDLDALSFVQEVPADGDDRVSDVNPGGIGGKRSVANWTAHEGALAVESDERDRSVRHG
jgi:hypothetical protein